MYVCVVVGRWSMHLPPTTYLPMSNLPPTYNILPTYITRNVGSSKNFGLVG